MDKKVEVNKDLKLISKIIESRDFLTPRKKGVQKEMLEGPGRKLWEFIEEYWDKYNSLPTIETINELLTEAKITLWQVSEPLEFLCEEIVQRESFEQLKKLQFDLDKWMVDLKPEDVVSNIQTFLRKQNEKTLGDLNILDARDVLPEVLVTYERTEKGLMGIKTPYQTMDDWTGGWNNGDLYFFVARSGHGKTWCVTLTVHAALKQKKKVLYLSAEMSAKDLIYRHVAIDFKIPYGPFRKARLDPIQKEKLNRAMKEYQQDRLLKVVDVSGGVNTSAIEAAIDQVRPDLVVLDAAYRVKAPTKTKDRFENLAIVTQELKSICGRNHIPIVASTQLNRESTKKKGEIGTEDLAMSDVLGWESSGIFALYQDDDHKKNHRMAIFPVKVREMEKSGKPLLSKWDFSNMDFSEVGDFEAITPVNPIDHF